jgi:AmiR/NasT family two-component response regulator
MSEREYGHLRILVANQLAERAETVSEIARSLGHEIVALELDVDHVAERTRIEHPDVALVGLGESSEHALELIEQIVRSAACPVILMLDAKNAEFVNEAAKRGVFAYLVDGDPSELQAALDIVLRRFAEFHNLEGAFGRRATIERAKGILMAIHGIDEQKAGLQQRVATIKAQMRPLLEWGSTGKRQRHVRALAKNLLKLWPALWTFADVSDVEPTNNAAERGLRAAVIYRKLSLGSRSQGGERTIERLLSVDQTCRLQRRSLYAYLADVLTAKARSDPIPILI